MQADSTKEPSRRATRIGGMLHSELAALCFASKPATVPPESRCVVLRFRGNRKNNCLLFEGSKFRRPCNEVLSECYPLKIKAFCIAEVVGMVGAKAKSCMVTAFNPMRRNRDSVLRSKADGPNTQTEHSLYA